MLEMIIGVAVGYVAFTPKGREIGNKAADFLGQQVKKVIDNVKPAEDTAAESKSEFSGNHTDVD